MAESSKSLVVNKQQLKKAIYVNIMANDDQQYLINRFVGIIADNFVNEDIVVNIITAICNRGDNHDLNHDVCDEDIAISELEPMDIF